MYGADKWDSWLLAHPLVVLHGGVRDGSWSRWSGGGGGRRVERSVGVSRQFNGAEGKYALSARALQRSSGPLTLPALSSF